MQEVKTYVEIILPIAVKGTFRYEVPTHLIDKVEVGKRGVVPFGSKLSYCGVIFEIHNTSPVGFNVKNVDGILDDYPIIDKIHLEYWFWISSYYLCGLGEVLNAALPSGLKIDYSDRIVINEEHTVDKKILTDNEYLALDALEIH